MPIISNPIISEGDCFLLFERDVLLRKDGFPITLDELKKLKEQDGDSDLFEEPEHGVCVLNLSHIENVEDDYERRTIRSCFAEAEEEEGFRLARAKALANWRRSWKFCHCCGEELVDSDKFTARVCPKCGSIFFPRIEPCVIVLVRKGDRILLARHAQRNQNVYSCLAGFIEAGESAEHAVCREVFEETGIRVKNVTYRGSQSWPFPDQLMLAFTAEYESGELRPQEEEIADVAWFEEKDCPATPQPGSIAYKLIHGLY